MPFLNEANRQRIEDAVIAAEQRTAAEFVTVVTRASGDYLHLPTLVAAIGTFVVSGLALLLPWPFWFGHGEFFAAQVLLFLAFYALCRWSPVRFRLIPRAHQRRRAQQRAHQLFLDLGLASVRDRTGVLFYVSVAEHYVEIIADRGVKQVIDDAFWEKTIVGFTCSVRAGRVTEGFVSAIDATAAVLAERLPRRPDDVDELPNRLLIL
jgi:putative membrane protein